MLGFYNSKQVARLAEIDYRTLMTARFMKTKICGIQLPVFVRHGRVIVCTIQDGEDFANRLHYFRNNHITFAQLHTRLNVSLSTARKGLAKGQMYGVPFPTAKKYNQELWFDRREVEGFIELVNNHILDKLSGRIVNRT